MMADFQKVFNPTEEDKEEQAITYLQLLAQLIRDKDCCTCKHSESRKTYMHSYETYESYCLLKNKSCYTMKNDTCDKYEVREVQDLL